MNQQELESHIARVLEVEMPETVAMDVFYNIVKRVFKPALSGTENVPDKPCLFVGNHSLFALDGWVIGPVIQKELGRFIRGLGDRFLFDNEKLADFVIQAGGVIGHPDVCTALMENGSDLMVFPGGAHEAVKPASEMYTLQWKERYGFVKLAANHGYTIMPFGLVGPDEFYGHLIEGKELPDSMLGRLLTSAGVLSDDTRTDLVPPVPVGILGSPLPKPQRCFLGFGNAVDLSAHKGKSLSKKQLAKIRGQVANEVEEQIAEMLLLRERHKGEDSLLRRFLNI